MGKWIVLLRGINVSGQKKIIMAELRGLLTASGFANVTSYIQSGNLIFDAKAKTRQVEIENAIAQIIESNYGYEISVFAFQNAWLRQVITENPYLEEDGIEQKQLYLSILDRVPNEKDIARLESFEKGADEYIIKESVIYLRYPNGAGKAKLTNNLIETKLKLRATSRNWNTTKRLLELSQ